MTTTSRRACCWSSAWPRCCWLRLYLLEQTRHQTAARLLQRRAHGHPGHRGQIRYRFALVGVLLARPGPRGRQGQRVPGCRHDGRKFGTKELAGFRDAMRVLPWPVPRSSRRLRALRAAAVRVVPQRIPDHRRRRLRPGTVPAALLLLVTSHSLARHAVRLSCPPSRATDRIHSLAATATPRQADLLRSTRPGPGRPAHRRAAGTGTELGHGDGQRAEWLERPVAWTARRCSLACCCLAGVHPPGSVGSALHCAARSAAGAAMSASDHADRDESPWINRAVQQWRKEVVASVRRRSVRWRVRNHRGRAARILTALLAAAEQGCCVHRPGTPVRRWPAELPVTHSPGPGAPFGTSARFTTCPV